MKYLPKNAILRGLIIYVAAIAATLIATQFLFPGSGSGDKGTPAAILFKGMCAGVANALPAAGVVLLYRTLRIVSFAQTVLGVTGAVLMFELIQYTEVPFPIAFVMGVLLSAGVGVVFGIVTLRFFNASRLFLTVFTVLAGFFLANTSEQIRHLPFFPTNEERTDAQRQLLQSPKLLLPLKNLNFQVGDLPVKFGFPELFTLEMALLALIALMLFLRYTRSGVAVRALAENAERASLLGIGVGKLSVLVWGVAGALSGVGIILYGSITTVNNATEVDLTVLAIVLAAAVVGRFTSLPVTIGASILLGVVDQAWTFSYDDNLGVFDAIVFVVVAGALLFQRRRGRSEEGAAVQWTATDELRPIPKELAGIASVRWARLGLIAAGSLIVIVYPFVAPTNRVVLAGVVFIKAIAVMSLVVLTGWTGQVSIGNYAFVAIGAVVGGALSYKAHIPFWFAVPLATGVTAAIAALIGIPALRIKGLFLLVATFCFAIAVQQTLFDRQYFAWLLPDQVERPHFFFLDFEEERSMYFLCLAAFVLTILAVVNLRRSRVGRLLIAIRDNEPNVQAFGVNVVRMKVLAFTISGGMAGFAGAILAHHQRGVTEDAFELRYNIELLTQAVFGGVTSVAGALLGSAFYNVGQALISSQFFFAVVSTGLPLMLMFAFPGGIIQMFAVARDSVLRVIAQRRQIVVPSLFADYDASALERQLIPLGEPLSNSGLAALPPGDRFVMVSELYQGKGDRIADRIGPSRDGEETAALTAAAASVGAEAGD